MNLDQITLAADSARMQAGGRSLFEKAGDALTAGVAGATISGLGSIYNTGIWVANAFGANLEEIETGKVLSKINTDWQSYYEDNKGVIDTVGFIGGSFIPGGLALKAFNKARAGQSAGVLRSAMGYTLHKQEAYLEAGLKQIAVEGTSVFGTLNKNKLASMAFGAADNVLQAAVFETAAAVAMKQSPTLDNESWTDISWDIFRNALVGGAIGGGIEALWTNKIFRTAGKAVDAKSRKFDTIVALESTSASTGDKAFSIIDDVLNLQKGISAEESLLTFTYRVNGKDKPPLELDLGPLLEAKRKANIERGYTTMQANLVEVAGMEKTAAVPFGAALIDIAKQGQTLGKTDGQIREELATLLGNLEVVGSLGGGKVDFTKDTLYVMQGAHILDKKGNLEKIENIFSGVRPSNTATGYRLMVPETQLRVGLIGSPEVGKTVPEAWAAGYDIVYSGKRGRVHVNPNSSRLVKAEKAASEFIETTFNVRTKQTANTAVMTVADTLKTGSPVVSKTGVKADTREFNFSQTATKAETSLDSVENTARHLWASQLDDFEEVTIGARDFSLLDRLVEKPELISDSTKILLEDGSIIAASTSGLRSFVLNQKIKTAQELLLEAGPDIDHRLISYALNTEQKWMQDAIAAEFRAEMLDTPEAFRQLSSYVARDNVKLTYRRPSLAEKEGDFATGLLAYEYRKKLAVDHATSAATFVLGTASTRFLDWTATKLRGTFDGTNTGPSAFGTSNANYDDLGRVWAQDVGKATYLTRQERREEALSELQPHLAKVINQGSPELGAILQRVRFSDRPLALLDGRIVDLDSLKEFRKLSDAGKDVSTFEFKYAYAPKKEVYDLLAAYHKGHQKWLDDKYMLAAAAGKTLHWDREALYLPPVNTRKVPYFAFVRHREGRVFASSEVAMITAKDSAELQRLATKVAAEHPDLQVIFKTDVELYKKALGDYEYSKSLNSPVIDPMLRKKGYLGNYVPTLTPTAVAEEFVEFIAKREDDLVRSAVATRYNQTFAELDWLSEQYKTAQESKFGFQGKLQAKQMVDPFGDYKRLALDVSKQSEYTLWNQMNEFVDALGTRAHNAVETATKDAATGRISWIDANKTLERVGLSGVFSSQEDFIAAQHGADRSLAKTLVAKGNMILANVVLRLDAANALINVVSAPIMLGTEVSAIRESIKKDKALLAAFEGNLQQKVPGQQFSVPSTTKLLYNAIHNFFGPEKGALIRRYEDIGAIRSDVSQFHDMIDSLALTPKIVPSKFSEALDRGVEFGAKWTGNNGAEQLVRFVASDVMRQITQPVVAAGRMTHKEQNAFISIFVNRVHGNYIASQRPIAFQGVLGAAIGLFQTYQFNLIQQVFRHIEDKNTKTIAIGAALQSTIFGMNGLPMFDAINTHLIGNANINEKHRDIYSTVAEADKEWGEFAMYGMSGFPLFGDQFPALFTRGDLNPRHITILPTSFSSIPVVEAFTRLGTAVVGVAQQVAQGGNFGSAMLHGLEHNGISRPLAGLTQVLQGYRTTGNASLVSAHEDLISIATATRLLGAKPMDESVALNYKFRQTAYKAADLERIEKLGAVVKAQIRSGQLTEEDILNFAERYAAVGGRLENYGAAMQRWMRDANQSVLNTAMNAHRSPQGQRLFEIMGGDPLPDLVNTAPEGQ